MLVIIKFPNGWRFWWALTCRPNALAPPPQTEYIHCIPIRFALDISYEGTRSAHLNLVGYGGVSTVFNRYCNRTVFSTQSFFNNFSIGSAASPIICSCSLSGKLNLNLCTQIGYILYTIYIYILFTSFYKINKF